MACAQQQGGGRQGNTHGRVLMRSVPAWHALLLLLLLLLLLSMPLSTTHLDAAPVLPVHLQHEAQQLAGPAGCVRCGVGTQPPRG
jgi:hypothetical protein